MDPAIPFRIKLAGTGALGDLGSHTIGLAHFLVGDIVEVCGIRSTIIKERSVPSGGSGYAAEADARCGRLKMKIFLSVW